MDEASNHEGLQGDEELAAVEQELEEVWPHYLLLQVKDGVEQAPMPCSGGLVSAFCVAHLPQLG